jgi:hypothetical protein
MKHVVSVSLGSPERNKSVIADLNGVPCASAPAAWIDHHFQISQLHQPRQMIQFG